MKMRSRAKKWLVFCCMMVLGMLCSLTVSAESTIKVKFNGSYDYDSANSVYSKVNQERTAAGLSTLKSNSQLQEEAMFRAAELAISFSHTRPDGTKGSLIISNRKGWYGENIAVGYRSAASVMTGWMNSSGHRDNILNTSYTQVGVGCFYHAGTYYWVQLFNGNTTSGTLQTGVQNVTMWVDVLPSLLNLYMNTSYVSIDEADSQVLTVIHRNASNSSYSVTLRADSPGFTWSSSGGISLTQNGSSVTVEGVSAGTGTVNVTCQTASASASVSVTHVPGELSCTEGQFCLVCNTKLQDAPGHSKTDYKKCQYGIRCSRCGLQFEAPSHTPGAAATCTTSQKCTVCREVLQEKLGHNYSVATCMKRSTCMRCGITNGYYYGDHVW